MLIKIGCELSLVVSTPTHLVDVHPSRAASVASETAFATDRSINVREGTDIHGNRVRRFVIPGGETTLLFSGLVHDDGLPDHRDAEALVTAVTDLPEDVRWPRLFGQ